MSQEEARSRRALQCWTGLVCLALALASAAGQAVLPGVSLPPEIRHGRELLQNKQFAEAKDVFAGYVKAHPDDVQGELGLGDAQLGLRELEPAEATYRAITAQQPELWQAHRNLVVVEAALGRWEDFERERTVLRLARERGAPGISVRESDVIDSFTVAGQRWVVRAYFEPVGRSQALYNFERFSPSGRVEAYVSLEDAAAAEAALHPGDVHIGAPEAGEAEKARVLALNWYTGTAHGTVRRYPASEPSYEHLRAEVIRWLRSRPAALRAVPSPLP